MNTALAQYGRILRNRWRWPLWGALAALLAIGLLLLVWPPLYRTEARVLVRTPGDISRVVDGGEDYAQTQAATYAALAAGTGLSQRVVADLGLKLAPETLSARVHAVHLPGTALVSISVAAPSSEEARRTADVLISELTATVKSVESIPGALIPRAELVTVDPPAQPERITPWGARLYVVLIGAAVAGAVLGALAAVAAFLARPEPINTDLVSGESA